MKREIATRAAVFCALVGVAAGVRLVTEMPNFNAVVAAAMFAGFYFRSRLTAFFVPLLAMVISDVWLGGYHTAIMGAVYLSMCVPIAWRTFLRKRISPLSVGSGAVCSTLTHFVLTNLAVWYLWYPQSYEGLARCFTVAVPFLVNALASNLLFAAGFFGLYVAIVHLRSAPAPRLTAEAA